MGHRKQGRRGTSSGLSRSAYGVIAAVVSLIVIAGITVAVTNSNSAVRPQNVSASVRSATVSGSSTPVPSQTQAPVTATTTAPTATPTPTVQSPSQHASTSSATAAGNDPRTLTLVNDLQQTIWPAVAADPNHPISATGWVLAPGASLTIGIPDHWDVRVWARTGCVFNSSGTGHCVTGDCAGKFQCGSTWGQFPSTLAEFNLNAWNGMDFYDVSLVEGNNLPMWINNSGGKSPDQISSDGCVSAGCTKNANVGCPSALQRTNDGQVVACLSACLAIGGDQTCCLGQYSSRAACDPTTWPVDSAAVFKKAEPFAYSYVNDDATSVLTCSGECDYRITWGVSP
jgi:hypothetical protein